MKFFSSIFGGTPWNLEDINPPWGSRPSIYQHIVVQLRSTDDGRLGHELPDEEIVRGDSKVSWAGGAMDGVFGHHVAGAGDDLEKTAADVLGALRRLSEKSSDANAAGLYSLLTENRVLSIVDKLLETIISGVSLDPERVQLIARWLAKEAADREPVKFAVALLGLFPGTQDLNILMTLGKHDEFTLFAAVALSNTQEDSEVALWNLAKEVHGWGRIHIVERLTETRNPAIMDWMLREGFHNEVMDEYTALICARAGAMDIALQDSEIDDQLLRGCGSILSTLFDGNGGGAAEGIEAYENGASASESYLKRISERDAGVEAFVTVSDIARFIDDEESGIDQLPEPLGEDWNRRIDSIRELIETIRSKPDWREKIEAELRSADDEIFNTATQAARAIDIDIWDHYFERIKAGKDMYWWHAATTDVPSRLDTLVEYAEKTFPLEEIASGPGEELGLGPEFPYTNAMNALVSVLGKYPGKGWPLVRASLMSKAIRDRNVAINTLTEWGKDNWTPEIRSAIETAAGVEPVEDVRVRFNELLG